MEMAEQGISEFNYLSHLYLPLDFDRFSDVKRIIEQWWIDTFPAQMSLKNDFYRNTDHLIIDTPRVFGADWDLTVNNLVHLATALKQSPWIIGWSGHLRFTSNRGLGSTIKFKVFIDFGGCLTLKIKLSNLRRDNWELHEEQRIHTCRLGSRSSL